ncbi:MAG: hypothetical protein QW472_04975 [Candidatus Aenigmatarchaeota archaeon]
MKRISLIILMTIFLFPSITFAEIVCRNCFVGDCKCTITDCDSGILDIFSSTSCSMMPDYEFTFSGGYLKWSPESARSYYAKALCSDGKTQSECSLITVKVVEEETTTTTRPKTTTTTTLPVSKEGGPDYLLIVLVVILIAVILFAVYYFFFLKKAGKKTYEELYRKWGRR